MNITVIEPKDFVKNEWSGGTTTQIYIYPKEANLADRDFDMRISSATFTDTKSNFSDFSGYQRYLLPLVGKIYLSHDGKYDRTIKPYEVDYFMGDWVTYSENTLDTVDFNLIVKKDIQCNLAVLEPNQSYIPKRTGKLFVFSTSNCELQLCSDKELSLSLDRGSLIVIEEEEKLHEVRVKDSDIMGLKVVFCEVMI